jgi:hypothetical protein
MKKITTLVLALGLAVPVNAISSVKKTQSVTKTNCVACTVVGVGTFIAGAIIYR